MGFLLKIALFGLAIYGVYRSFRYWKGLFDRFTGNTDLPQRRPPPPSPPPKPVTRPEPPPAVPLRKPAAPAAVPIFRPLRKNAANAAVQGHKAAVRRQP